MKEEVYYNSEVDDITPFWTVKVIFICLFGLMLIISNSWWIVILYLTIDGIYSFNWAFKRINSYLRFHGF